MAFLPLYVYNWLFGSLLMSASVLFYVYGLPTINRFSGNLFTKQLYLGTLVIFFLGLLLFCLGFVVHTDKHRIKAMIRRRLFYAKAGNPLGLHEGDELPKVSVHLEYAGRIIIRGEIRIETTRTTADKLIALAPVISATLRRKFAALAVVATDTDPASTRVVYKIEDVNTSRKLKFDNPEDMYPQDVTKIAVQRDTYIDLTTSGSMLFAGKTRSGKTTAIISILIQILALGRDRFQSKVMILDPKRAELSMLPHVYAPSENGDAHAMLNAVKQFAATITKRQHYLNELSIERGGNAVHWWEAAMKPSILFIDEFVALRTLLPKRATKDDPDYSLAAFDNLLKRIITMGASSGSYVIISIAQANADELPTMLRDALSSRVLMRPTLAEARLLWDSRLLETIPERIYKAGQAWFTSTDGAHDDNVHFVDFPLLNFGEYQALGHLLKRYYS